MTTMELESHLQRTGKDSGEAGGGDLRSEPCEEGRNTQAERKHEDAGNSNGT